jgi:hypothetical protein
VPRAPGRARGPALRRLFSPRRSAAAASAWRIPGPAGGSACFCRRGGYGGEDEGAHEFSPGPYREASSGFGGGRGGGAWHVLGSHRLRWGPCAWRACSSRDVANTGPSWFPPGRHRRGPRTATLRTTPPPRRARTAIPGPRPMPTRRSARPGRRMRAHGGRKWPRRPRQCRPKARQPLGRLFGARLRFAVTLTGKGPRRTALTTTLCSLSGWT